MSNGIIAGMPLGVVVVDGKQYSGSLITDVTQEVSLAPNQLLKQGQSW